MSYALPHACLPPCACSFFAKPTTLPDGSVNLMKWECGIPGKEKTPWAGGVYKLSMEFDESYPSKPPLCKFTPPIFHTNVFPDGRVCLSILFETYAEGQSWSPTLTIPQVLLGIQELLDTPNATHAAQPDAHAMINKDPKAYAEKAKATAALHKGP